MRFFNIPEKLGNNIGKKEVINQENDFFNNINPHNGEIICKVMASKKSDVEFAIKNAKENQMKWASIPPVKRGQILFEIAELMEKYKNDIAEIVSNETGKILSHALGEVGGAIAEARFNAGEGQRFFGRTTTSGVENKYAMTIREPLGVAGLIIASNTPIANVAWKVFPALICGNAVVLKASEDAPLTSWIFGKICEESKLPDGVLNIVQGFGKDAGQPLVESEDVQVISFTGSTAVGKMIASVAGQRLAKVSLELGGKNPLVVCDDADLEKASNWIINSSFSNAGQRCAASSRIIVFESIYEKLKNLLIEKTKKLSLGVGEKDYLGPVINERQLINMLKDINKAVKNGAKIIVGGKRMLDEEHKKGFYMEPTIIENVAMEDEISRKELFGPITCLYKAKDFKEAIEMANDSPYALTACIHTKNVNRATEFSRKVISGVAVINGGTHGSEPHMPFGGPKNSGNGSREPGPEALDVYSNLKDIYQFVDIENL
ncbi:MAG: aldehyde dehydrogenase [Candidatus Muiribacterium halophilum]|uniref:Aldehyde dehydrogenase n=1 Tax=Muiribacterium halophilum TaxID=2053465 RepID=A0A2N5ZA04_MUIH1|nr:MAG: aldehyde dehydrogenase [Candidatus Muirbacterium halophilum]